MPLRTVDEESHHEDHAEGGEKKGERHQDVVEMGLDVSTPSPSEGVSKSCRYVTRDQG